MLSCPLPRRGRIAPRPRSQSALPGGKGGILVYFAGGYRPRHPGIKPLAALTASAMRTPRAREPAVHHNTDRSPFLRAVPAAKERGDRGRGTSAFEMVLSPGAGIASAARAQPRGCKGRSPLHKKTQKSPPFPPGRGLGGMGEKEKGQGGGGGRQSRQAPQWIPERQSHPATTRASSPQGATVARSASAASGSAPGGCKGRSPLHKKTKKSPPSPEGKSALRARSGGYPSPSGKGARKY